MTTLILYFFSLVGLFHFLMLLFAKYYKCNLSEARQQMLNNLHDGLHEIFSELFPSNSVHIELILNQFEAMEHAKSILRFCESAVYVQSGCDKNFFILCYEVAGIKQKFQTNLNVAKRALEIDLQRHYQRLRQLEQPPTVLCTSFIEGQLTFKVALTNEAARLLLDKKFKEDIKK